jgi:hypothetical protein
VLTSKATRSPGLRFVTLSPTSRIQYIPSDQVPPRRAATDTIPPCATIPEDSWPSTNDLKPVFGSAWAVNSNHRQTRPAPREGGRPHSVSQKDVHI